jgi:hypothetical protein
VARLFGSMTGGASGRGFFDLAIKFSFRYVRCRHRRRRWAAPSTCLTGGSKAVAETARRGIIEGSTAEASRCA